MTRTTRHATIAALAALAAVVAIITADFTQPASAQSDDETVGRIVARHLEDGRVEFGWQPAGGSRILPRQRYFPPDAQVDRWLRSSPVEVDGAAIGRINARLLENGRIEFAFTPTDGERIEPQGRYFPANARVGRWLRSTEITITPAGYTAVSAGRNYTCAIRASSGTITCWGSNHFRQIDAPDGRFTAVSAGDIHTCAIRESGEIACWGWNELGQADPPDGTFTAVSAGVLHTCAIRANNGAIMCWGSNSFIVQIYSIETGQIDAPEGTFTGISIGYGNSCAIRESGEIACWGANGQPYITGEGIGRMAIRETGKSDPPDGRFTAVSAGDIHTCAIRESGEIACWGANELGQTDAPEGRYTAVSAKSGHTCAIRASDSTIMCWGGDNETYRRDDTGEWRRIETGQTDAPEGSFATVSAGGWHTCAIRMSDSAIVCWGLNDEGQTDAPTE